jgi:hypothetical protein
MSRWVYLPAAVTLQVFGDDVVAEVARVPDDGEPGNGWAEDPTGEPVLPQPGPRQRDQGTDPGGVVEQPLNLAEVGFLGLLGPGGFAPEIHAVRLDFVLDEQLGDLQPVVIGRSPAKPTRRHLHDDAILDDNPDPVPVFGVGVAVAVGVVDPVQELACHRLLWVEPLVDLVPDLVVLTEVVAALELDVLVLVDVDLCE